MAPSASRVARGILTHPFLHRLTFWRWFFALGCALALLGALTLPTGAQSRDVALSPEARAIAEKIQCPVCQGESIAESNSDVAYNMRRRVQEMVDQGYTEQEVLDKFVADFGVFILREPPKEGIGLGVWIVPPVVLGGGVGVLYLVLRRWRREELEPGEQEAWEDDEAEARVEEDVRRWEDGS